MNKAAFWSPRILAILFILFVSLFAFDSFSVDRTITENFVSLLIHLVPTMVLTLLLILSWKVEWTGILVFAALGFAYILIFRGRFPIITYLIISGPLFLISLLFLISWLTNKYNKKTV